MPKLAKNMYTTAKGERKLNCYVVNIPKEVVVRKRIFDYDNWFQGINMIKKIEKMEKSE